MPRGSAKAGTVMGLAPIRVSAALALPARKAAYLYVTRRPRFEGDGDSEQCLRPRPAAPAIEPQTEAEVGGDRDQHDEDEARLAPAVEDEAHAEEPQIAQAAPSGEVAGED